MASLDAGHASVPKRLILCVDGTWCTPDGNKQSVPEGSLTTVYNFLACVKEGRVVDQDGRAWIQEKHYNDGIGALEKQGTVARLKAGIAGDGFKELIEDVYRRCCELSEDDQVWLLGFSRGAYVVRAVAGLLHYIRKLRSKGNDFHRDYKKALKVYAAVQGKHKLGAGQINHLLQCDTLPSPTVQFVGVFDTVKAVNDDFLYDISLNDSIRHLRHALALHEDRRDFTPEYLFPDTETLSKIDGANRTFVQAWFAGAHIDMGGSAKEAGLALYPLQWMLLECRNLGLALEFHGNARHAPVIDDPLKLVFPTDADHGKGAELWYCQSKNSIRTEMQDLRKVHVLPAHRLRYTVKVNRAAGMWFRKDRDPFEKGQGKTAESVLQGYYLNGPAGTIIHPSVYSLIDENVTVVMETKHAQLIQNLSEWSGIMLGEIDHVIDDGLTKITKRIPNPGFWSRSDNYEIDVESLPPLRILVCGYPGVGKSTLVSKVFGVDLGSVSERRSGRHKVHEGIRIEGRDDFILHDSQGFEGGGAGELEDVKSFIRQCAAESDLANRLHVIWFCLETNTTRTTQTASQGLFEVLAECEREIPVVLVATKKDQFLNMRVGEKMSELESEGLEHSPELYAKCRAYADMELEKRAQLMVDEISNLEGSRVDAWVPVSKSDPRSIERLTELSASVFKDEATRLMYMKAQMSRPDLKMNMAIFMAMRRYRHAVGAATTSGLFPTLPTLIRKGVKDDICRRILACFGVRGLDTSKALKIMQDNLSDGSVSGIKTYWGEVLAFLSTGSIYMAAPLTAPSAAGMLVPHMAHLFLCTACDLILILAKSFQVASHRGKLRPDASDVEAAARLAQNYAANIHKEIVILIPSGKPLSAFQYGSIQATVQSLLETSWSKLAADISKSESLLSIQGTNSSNNSATLAVRSSARST